MGGIKITSNVKRAREAKGQKSADKGNGKKDQDRLASLETVKPCLLPSSSS